MENNINYLNYISLKIVVIFVQFVLNKLNYFISFFIVILKNKLHAAV